MHFLRHQFASLQSPCPSNGTGFTALLMCKLLISSCLACPGWLWGGDRGGMQCEHRWGDSRRRGLPQSAPWQCWCVCPRCECVCVQVCGIQLTLVPIAGFTLARSFPTPSILPGTVPSPSLQHPLSASQMRIHKRQVSREGD